MSPNEYPRVLVLEEEVILPLLKVSRDCLYNSCMEKGWCNRAHPVQNLWVLQLINAYNSHVKTQKKRQEEKKTFPPPYSSVHLIGTIQKHEKIKRMSILHKLKLVGVYLSWILRFRWCYLYGCVALLKTPIFLVEDFVAIMTKFTRRTKTL